MSWFKKLSSGLSKTSSGISNGISNIFTKRKLDDEMLEELEELLILSDMGAATAAKIVADFGEGRFDKELEPDEVKAELATAIAKILEPVAIPLDLSSCGRGHDVSSAAQDIDSAQSQSDSQNDEAKTPHVILVVGVNGNGKTTTIGKMAHYFKNSEFRIQNSGEQEGGQESDSLVAEGVKSIAQARRPERGRPKKIMLCAADTFRAAAVEQLQIWGDRVGCETVTGADQADPASVAYEAFEKAKAQGADVLIIDTAGRLHNQKNLMEELKKIERVLQKIDETAPHSVVQVLDGTTGQNALQQVAAFKELVDVSGLVVTKLDGTAKAGVVVALAEQFGLPIHAIGVGEGIDDLQPFTADEFAQGLMG